MGLEILPNDLLLHSHCFLLVKLDEIVHCELSIFIKITVFEHLLNCLGIRSDFLLPFVHSSTTSLEECAAGFRSHDPSILGFIRILF
jgi:hypothetical protein